MSDPVVSVVRQLRSEVAELEGALRLKRRALESLLAAFPQLVTRADQRDAADQVVDGIDLSRDGVMLHYGRTVANEAAPDAERADEAVLAILTSSPIPLTARAISELVGRKFAYHTVRTVLREGGRSNRWRAIHQGDGQPILWEAHR